MADLNDPAGRLHVVTPSDSGPLPFPTTVIYVGVNGNLQVTDMFNNVVVLPLLAGVPYYLRVHKIWSTNTTATGIIVGSSS